MKGWDCLFRWIFKRALLLCLLALTGIVLLFASLWFEHRTEITLPTPSGPFSVGRQILGWTDDSICDSLPPTPGTKRELLVWIWYPTDKSYARTSDSLPAPLRS